MNEKSKNISGEALELLEVIISNGIKEINYKHPRKTLGEYMSGRKGDQYYQDLLEEINGMGVTGQIMTARVKFTLAGYEFGTKYFIDLDRAKELYGEQKRIKDTEEKQPEKEE